MSAPIQWVSDDAFLVIGRATVIVIAAVAICVAIAGVIRLGIFVNEVRDYRSKKRDDAAAKDRIARLKQDYMDLAKERDELRAKVEQLEELTRGEKPYR